MGAKVALLCFAIYLLMLSVAIELESLSTLARLHCGEAARDYIAAVASKFDEAQQSGSVMFNFTSSGFEADEFVEMKEQLLTMADDYDTA